LYTELFLKKSFYSIIQVHSTMIKKMKPNISNNHLQKYTSH